MNCPKCHSDEVYFEGQQSIQHGQVEFRFFVCRTCGTQFVENPEEEDSQEVRSIPTREELLEKIRWQHEIEDNRQLKVNQLLRQPAFAPPPLYGQLKEMMDREAAGPKDFEALLAPTPKIREGIQTLGLCPLFSEEPPPNKNSSLLELLEPPLLLDLVLALEVLETLDFPKDCPRLERTAFWRHSLICGATSLWLARFLGLEEAPRYFLPGFLMNIGHLVIASHSPEIFQEITSECLKSGKPLWKMEEALLDFHHGQVGSSLLKEWGQPVWVTQALRYQHQPLEARQFVQPACILHAGEILAQDMKSSPVGEIRPPQADPEAVRQLGLTRSLVDQIKTEVSSWTAELEPLVLGPAPTPISRKE